MATLNYTALMQLVNAYARAELTANEFNLLAFLTQRMSRFKGKRSEYIPMKHFTHGVFSGDGELIVAPVAKDERTVRRAIKGLIDKGYLTMKNTTAANYYTLLVDNINAIVCKIKESFEVGKLKVSKKHQNGAKPSKPATAGPVDPPAKMRVPPPCENAGQSKGRLDTSKGNGVSGSSPAAPATQSGFSAAYEKVKDASLRRRKERAAKASLQINMRNIEAAWAVALEKHHPQARTGQRINRKQLMMLLGSFKATSPGAKITEVIDWTVEHWVGLHGGDLSWLDPMTPAPDLQLFCRLYKFFYDSYSKGIMSAEDQKKRIAGASQRAQEPREDYQSAKELKAAKRRLADQERLAKHWERVAKERASRAHRDVPDTLSDLADELPEWESKE